MHTGFAGEDHAGRDLNKVADGDRLIEADAADINGYTILAAPVGSTGIASLVNPFHYGAAVYFASKVNVGGFGQEPEGNGVAVNAFCHALYDFGAKANGANPKFQETKVQIPALQFSVSVPAFKD